MHVCMKLNVLGIIVRYRPKIRTACIIKKTIKIWTPENIDQLKGCFECTDWGVMIESSTSIDQATDVITSYIRFCEDNIVSKKSIKKFHNNKPWDTKRIKNTLNEKKIAFQSGSLVDRKIVQAKLRKELKEGKRKYKTKIENLFKSKNVADTWKGLKTLTGENSHGQSQSSMTTGERRTFSNNLNDFFCRYENVDHNLNMSDLINRTSGQSPYDGFTINKKDVKMVFTKVNVRKSVGPDGICSKLLKVCAPQLCQVFSTLFTWSLKDGIVPGLWKTSMICPIPKNNSPSDLSDYRPIAITSVVMKCFEKIVLHHLLDLTNGMQDPFQFAYKPNRSIEDAILTLLHNTFLHTNNPKSYVRILFADFSSAFNTIKPYHLAKKLVRLNISPKLVIWIIKFLSHIKQFVRFKGVLYGERSISTGVPQGCVLSPVLFTLYTNDCTGTENTIFIKYSDDTAIVDLSNSIPHYIEEVDRFTTLCKAKLFRPQRGKNKGITY